MYNIFIERGMGYREAFSKSERRFSSIQKTRLIDFSIKESGVLHELKTRVFVAIFLILILLSFFVFFESDLNYLTLIDVSP